jgi:hypothetical protein
LRAEVPTGIGEASACQPKGWIAAQPVEVVAIGIAAANRQHASSQHIGDCVRDVQTIAPVGNVRGERVERPKHGGPFHPVVLSDVPLPSLVPGRLQMAETQFAAALMSEVPSTVTALTLLTPGFEEPPVIVTVPVARVSETAATLACTVAIVMS